MKSIGKILSYMILILAAFVSLFPFYFMFGTAQAQYRNGFIG